jgi:hypothetical protein
MKSYQLTINVLKENVSKNEEAKIIVDALQSEALESLVRHFNEKIDIAEREQKDIKQGRSGIRMKEIYEIVLTGGK